MTRQLFGTDGIRGVANVFPMTAEVALNIGRAATYVFKRNSHKPKIIIGKDTRLSGYMLEEALVSGICSMGGDAHLIGPIPTPGVAFMVQSQRAEAGIMVSASHNPYHDNGIKIFSSDGYKLPDSKEKEIEELILNNSLSEKVSLPQDLGKAYRIDDATGRYIVFLKNTFPRNLSMEGLKIVLDCANGAAYKAAPHVFWELGAEVLTIHSDPDGFNINDRCGSQYPSDLSNAVIKHQADIGMAFDGDADRLIAVDENGEVITGDKIIGICAKTLKEEHRLKNNIVVTTVMSNSGLTKALSDMEIVHIRADVGDRYVLETMMGKDAIIGGEDSGHIIFLDYHTAGDGTLTGLQLVASMLKNNKPLSELAETVPIYPQRLLNIEVSRQPDLSKLPSIQKAINEAENILGNNGRVLVRYSGTQQVCRIMAEGPDEKLIDTCCSSISEAVKNEIGV